MSLQLIVMRHAKSSWGDDTQADHERPLNKRGRRSAQALGQWLAQRHCVPQLVLSSDSARTRETWAGVAAQLPTSPEVLWDSELYLAQPDTVLRTIQTRGKGATLLVLAHNPGIAVTAERLVIELPEHRDFSRYPTGATTVLDVPINDWACLEWRSATVDAVVVPRELIPADSG